jgi:hypothetical protein
VRAHPAGSWSAAGAGVPVTRHRARMRVPARGGMREESGGSRLRAPAARGCVLRRIEAARFRQIKAALRSVPGKRARERNDSTEASNLGYSFVTLGLIHVRREQIPREGPKFSLPLRAHDARSSQKTTATARQSSFLIHASGPSRSLFAVRIISVWGSARALLPGGAAREKASMAALLACNC